MLVNLTSPAWWYMEIPRTGTTTLTQNLRRMFKEAKAPYAKHWPILPPTSFTANAASISLVSIRNPYSRAVSCWQFFTVPDSISFLDWTVERLNHGFFDVQIEARPQAFWFELFKWDFVITQENIDTDFWKFMARVAPEIPPQKLSVLNATNSDWVNRVNRRTKRDRPWQDYYCEQAKQNVLKLYNEDFVALDVYYSKEFPS